MTVENFAADAKPRSCPLCGHSKHELLFWRSGWDVVRCAGCRMVFLGHELDYGAQARDHDWVEEWEQEVLRRKRKEPVWVFLSRCTRPFRGGAHDRMLAQTLRRKRAGKLADLGCGEGLFLERAANYFDVTGVELSPRAAEAARHRVGSAHIIEGPVTEVTGHVLPEHAFDVVTLFGYLEHEWRPREGLRAARRILKPGGTLLSKVPNYASWNRTLRGRAMVMIPRLKKGLRSIRSFFSQTKADWMDLTWRMAASIFTSAFRGVMRA